MVTEINCFMSYFQTNPQIHCYSFSSYNDIEMTMHHFLYVYPLIFVLDEQTPMAERSNLFSESDIMLGMMYIGFVYLCYYFDGEIMDS